jgi:DNA repair exonuclease SbcCD ATPase subunit
LKKEQLTELGIDEETAKKILALNGSDIENAKSKFSDYETLKQQLADRDKDIETLKTSKATADDYQKQLTDLQTKYKTDTEKLAKEKADMQFNHALNGALTGAKAKNIKAVSALLNMDGLKHDGENIIGLKEQLESIKKDNAYLFEDDTPPVKFTGATNTNVATAAADKKTNEANAAIRSFLRKD